MVQHIVRHPAGHSVQPSRSSPVGRQTTHALQTTSRREHDTRRAHIGPTSDGHRRRYKAAVSGSGVYRTARRRADIVPTRRDRSRCVVFCRATGELGAPARSGGRRGRRTGTDRRHERTPGRSEGGSGARRELRFAPRWMCATARPRRGWGRWRLIRPRLRINRSSGSVSSRSGRAEPGSQRGPVVRDASVTTRRLGAA